MTRKNNLRDETEEYSLRQTKRLGESWVSLITIFTILFVLIFYFVFIRKRLESSI